MPRTRRNNRVKKRVSKKRPLNQYFKQMLSAKKAGLSSFQYKNKTYSGKDHPKLGMIYRKSN